MSVSLADAYKNKEYGWFITSIVGILASVKLAGIIGVLGFSLILSILYKIIKNPNLTQKKKVLLSSLNLIVGIIITGIVYYISVSTIINLTTNPPVKEIVDSNTAYPLEISSDSTVNLEKELYINNESNFQIRQPLGWVADYSDSQMIVQFNNPLQDKIGVITIASDTEMGKYSSKDYAAGTMQGFTEGGAKDVKILAQGNVNINGEEAYIVEFQYTQTIPDFGDLSIHAISASFVHKDRGYNILAVTQVETWSEYKATLNDSISTFRFLE